MCNKWLRYHRFFNLLSSIFFVFLKKKIVLLQFNGYVTLNILRHLSFSIFLNLNTLHKEMLIFECSCKCQLHWRGKHLHRHGSLGAAWEQTLQTYPRSSKYWTAFQTHLPSLRHTAPCNSVHVRLCLCVCSVRVNTATDGLLIVCQRSSAQ